MSRRQFVQSTLEVTAMVAASGAVAPLVLCSARRSSVYTLYDTRFGPALDAARAMAAGSPLQTVGGDVTDLAVSLLTRTRANQTLIIRGATTDSVPFCLEHLARSLGTPRLILQRLDRDLFTWTLIVLPP
jgi:hypothetical protein